MKQVIFPLSLAATATLAAGCASDHYGGQGGCYTNGYDGYSDDYYGPVDDGTGDGDVCFYRDGRGQYHRDEAHHFRREAAPASTRSTPAPPPGMAADTTPDTTGARAKPFASDPSLR